MNILVSGCSFTHWPETPGSENNICWPAHLQKLLPQSKITNLAEPAAGNLYIANSVVRALLDRPDHYDLVLVMWSGVSRLDFLTDITDPAWHALFDQYGFYRRVEACPNKLGYLFSGGQMGPWYANTATRKIFTEMYKISGPLSLAHTNLIEMVKTQEFLKQRKIPYRFMSYVNYWGDGEHLSPNGDFGVAKFPELRSIIDGLDFSQWIFSNDHRDGIYEMAKAANDYHGDRFHPGKETNRQWAQLVFDQLTDHQ